MMMTQALLLFKLDYFAKKSQEKCYLWDLGKASMEKKRFLSGIARIT